MVVTRIISISQMFIDCSRNFKVVAYFEDYSYLINQTIFINFLKWLLTDTVLEMIHLYSSPIMCSFVIKVQFILLIHLW